MTSREIFRYFTPVRFTLDLLLMLKGTLLVLIRVVDFIPLYQLFTTTLLTLVHFGVPTTCTELGYEKPLYVLIGLIGFAVSTHAAFVSTTAYDSERLEISLMAHQIFLVLISSYSGVSLFMHGPQPLIIISIAFLMVLSSVSAIIRARTLKRQSYISNISSNFEHFA